MGESRGKSKTHATASFDIGSVKGESNVHVWAEQSLFEKHDLDPAKKYVANVVYSEVLQDEDSDV